MSKILKIIFFYKKTFIFISSILVLGGIYYYYNRPKAPVYDYVVAERGNLTQEVSVTGKVKPASKVDLAFEATGKVATIYTDVGRQVFAGQKLAELNIDQYEAQYQQAKSGWEAEKSKLDDLKNGTRPEEIQIQEVKVENAEVALADAEKNFIDKIKDAYTKSDDAVRNRADRLFDMPRTNDPRLNFITDSALELDIENSRASLESILNDWLAALGDTSNLKNYSSTVKQNLADINYFLNKLSLAVNGMTPNSSLSQTTIDSYKTDIATARTNINTAISNLSTADEKVNTAESSLSLEQQTLALEKAGATSDQIKEQESRVSSAEANVNNYKAMIDKNVIYSPISGLVTKVDIKKGETAQINLPVITVISGEQLEIEAYIPEADIAKVTIGNVATVTLDAYEDNVIFGAKIISIDPAETVIDGVSTYKTILQFDKKDDRIRSGMTANTDIKTGSRENVVFIPSRLLRINNETYVEVLENGQPVKRVVQLGLRSTDGKVEVVSGVNEGDKVVTNN